MRKAHFAWVLSVSIPLVSLGLLPLATSQPVPNKPIRVEDRSRVMQEPDVERGRSATVEAIVESYIRFLGGRAAIKRHVSVVEKGYFDIVAGRAKTTIYQKKPNKYVEVIDFPNTERSVMGVDGVVAWNVSPEGQFYKATGEELRQAIREADFMESIYKLYPRLSLTSQQTVEGHSANVLETDFNDGYRRRMYFATESGELLRIDKENPDGVINIFFYDYRNVDGVKYPFVRREESPVGVATLHFDEIKTNVPIKNSFFSAPSSVSQIK